MTQLPADVAAFVDRITSDFGEFCKELWIDRGYDKVAPLSWVELDMCDWIANGPQFRGVLGPRGEGKTHKVCALSAWRLLRDCNRKIVIPSKSHTHAKKVVSLLREWLNNVWFLQHLCPRPDQVDSATQFQVNGAKPSLQPSVTAIGIDGQLEGNRAHTIIPDDVETDTNTETLDSREDLDRRLGELKDILYPYNPNLPDAPVDPPEIVYVGTYHHEESVYIKLNERGYAFRTWTLEYPEPGGGQMNLAPKIIARLQSGENKPGDLMFPLRFDRDNVNQKKAEGYTRYAMQHMLVATLSDTNRYPLRLSDLIVMDVPTYQAPIVVEYGQQSNRGSTAIEDLPCYGFQGDKLYAPIFLSPSNEHKAYSGTKAGIDPAGRGEDCTGLSIVSHLTGNLWLKGCYGLPGGVDTEAMDNIARLLRQHDCRDAYLEPNIDIFNTYEQLLNAALRRHFLEPGQDQRYPSGWKCSLTYSPRAAQQKELRIIATLEPVVTGHRLIVDRRVLEADKHEPQHKRFQYQFTRITKQRKCLKEDGKLDSLEIAIRAWDHTLGVNQQAVAERSLLEVQEDHLRKAGILRKPKAAARWFNLLE